MTQHTEPAAHESTPAHSAYHDGLPIGQRVSAAPLLESPFFGFEGDLRLARLEPMLVPEKPREGEHDASECFSCTVGIENAIWRDKHWHVGHTSETGLPFLAGLAPNAHVRLDEMDDDLLKTFGSVVQRLAPQRSRTWTGSREPTSHAGGTGARTSTCISSPARSA